MRQMSPRQQRQHTITNQTTTRLPLGLPFEWREQLSKRIKGNKLYNNNK